MKECNEGHKTRRLSLASVLVCDNHLCSVMGEVWVWLEHWDFIARENEKKEKKTLRGK